MIALKSGHFCTSNVCFKCQHALVEYKFSGDLFCQSQDLFTSESPKRGSLYLVTFYAFDHGGFANTLKNYGTYVCPAVITCVSISLKLPIDLID